MRIKYNKPKGQRVNKGTYKMEGRHRIPMFYGLTIDSDTENCWWSEGLNKWCNWFEVLNGSCGFETYNNNIKNLKQAIRHIKKHTELTKGTVLRLSCNFREYDITIIV